MKELGTDSVRLYRLIVIRLHPDKRPTMSAFRPITTRVSFQDPGDLTLHWVTDFGCEELHACTMRSSQPVYMPTRYVSANNKESKCITSYRTATRKPTALEIETLDRTYKVLRSSPRI